MHEEHGGKEHEDVNPDSGNLDPGLQDELRRLRRDLAPAGREEPPALIDQAVLNSAHRAVEPRGDRARRWPWLGGLATAAVAVLALSLLLLQPEAERPLPSGVDGFRLESGPAPTSAGAAARERRRALEATPDTRSEVPAKSQPGVSSAPAATAANLAEERPAQAQAREAVHDPVESDLADEPPDAAEWIKRLLELHAAGETDRLTSELAKFRAVYPGHPLPAELSE